MERTHEEIRELIAPYVLGAIEEEEAALVRSHVLSCEACMAEAEELSTAASALALSVDPMPLPTGFEDGVLDRIRGEEAASLRVVSSTSERTRWRRLAPALAAAAMLVVLGVLAVSLVNARSELSEERDAITTLLSSDQAMQLEGEEGGARMVATPDGGLFAAAGLDEAPEGHVYQVWLMNVECIEDPPTCRPVSAGTFEVEDGIGLLELDRSPEGFAAAAVTVEKGDGAEQPTTDPILTSL